VPLIVEFDKTEDSSECEEDQHGIQQDESGDAEPSDVYRFVEVRLVWLPKEDDLICKTHRIEHKA
jgi:hypothetical protein